MRFAVSLSYLTTLFFSLYILYTLHSDLAVIISALLLALGVTISSELSFEDKYRRFLEKMGIEWCSEESMMGLDTQPSRRWSKFAKWYATHFVLSALVLKVILLLTTQLR